MSNDPFSQTFYFKGLYDPADQNKIDLFSRSFYDDILRLFLTKKNSREREMILKGVRYLCKRIITLEEARLLS